MKKILYSVLTLILGLVLSSSGCNTMDTPDSDTYDKGVEIGGVVWATRNVAEFGKFAAAPEDAGMFYQWNRKTAWPVTGAVSGWDPSQDAGTVWEPKNDPCPAGWQVPTKAQFEALIASHHYAWEPLFGVNGCKFGNSTHFIFLPAAGNLSFANGAFIVSDFGFYFAKEQTDTQFANFLYFSPITLGISGYNKAAGVSIRCVKK